MRRRRKPPGRVRTDRQAFEQIRTRFEGEVGGILGRIDFVRGPVPFWALVRMMFPVAESIADLIYRLDNATSENLRKVLAKEFGEVRPEYKGKAAILAMLYRHSLTHQDEPRMLRVGKRAVGWLMSGAEDHRHLETIRVTRQTMMIHFQPRQFFKDIIKVCENAEGAKWAGLVRRRYNGWMTLNLIPTKTSHAPVIAEIAAL
jgi:hypothetical protein